MTQNSIGIIGLSALAGHLADRGVKVHTGEKVREAAREVNKAAEAAEKAAETAEDGLTILVADHKESAVGMIPWLRKMTAKHRVIFVRTPLPDGGHRFEMSIPGDRLEVPFDSAKLAGLTGMTFPDFAVAANGAIASQAPDAGEDDDGMDFFAELAQDEATPDQEETESWGSPAPVSQPASAPAESDAEEWGSPAPAARPAPVAVESDTEDWGSPAPVSPPAPVAFEDPIFETEDDEDDDWGGIPSVPAARPSRPVQATPSPVQAAPSFISEDSPSAFSQKKPGDVLFTWAAKGGVGKTSIAMMLAQRAAEKGKKVVLVDGNRGQGDVRKYLRLNTAGLPTAYDVASGARPDSAILHPKILRSNRPDTVDDIDFALVQAPSQGLANASVVNTDVYRQILDACREVAELVVIDTQIAEEDDTTKLHSELWVPAMASYAWNLAIADTSPPGVTNLKERITDHEKDGVPTSRTMSVINNASQTLDYNESKLGEYLGAKSNFVGFVKREASIEAALTLGNIPTTDPAIVRELDSILYRVTGDKLFAPAERTVVEQPVKKGLLGWLRR